MWTTFLADLLVGLAGALMGSLLTVAVGLLTYRLEAARRGRQALQGLIFDLHHRRSLTAVDAREVERAEALSDFRWATASVIDIRDRVRHARDQIRADSEVQLSLSEMTKACNNYLEATSNAPTRYGFELMELRQSLVNSVHKIVMHEPKLQKLIPGDAAF